MAFGFGDIDWDAVGHFFTEGCHNGPCGYWLLAAAYLALAVAALVQFIRIQLRLSDSGWTLQKAFHLFNVVLCLCRGITLFFWHEVQIRHYSVAELILLDVPTLMFFTTFTLLALFWAEIVSSSEGDDMPVRPRYSYLAVNFVVYLVMAMVWILAALDYDAFSRDFSTWFQFGLYAGVAAVFVLYGTKLFTLLKDSPVASDFKRRKMVEVSVVGTLCVVCFLAKAALVLVTKYKHSGGEYEEDDVLLNMLLLGVTEVLVIAAALGMLSDLPPKKEYQPIAEA